MNNVVPTDSPSVFAALNTLVLNSAQLAIIRPNNPPPGIAGFVLDIVGDDGVELESEIPDHYLEDLTAVQDQIALRPEIVTVDGDVAELVKTIITAKPITPANNPLPLVNGLQPELAPGATVTQAAAQQAQTNDETAIQSTQSLYGYYQSRSPQQPNQTKQSQIFGYFYQLQRGRQLFSVETPWGFFENMAILSLGAHQSADSKYVTNFTIAFKKVRTARSITIIPGLLAGRATFQQAPITQNGTIGQSPVSTVQSAQFYQRVTSPSP